MMKTEQDDDRWKHLKKIYFVSGCTLTLFMAFQPAQGFITPLHKKVGFEALAILYGVLAFSGLFVAQLFLDVFGAKMSMVISSVTYVAFIFCSSYSPVVFLLSSAVCGLFSAVFWVAVSEYVARCGAHVGDDGKVAGIFSGTYHLAAALGSYLTLAVYSSNPNSTRLLYILSAVATLATVEFALISRAPPSSSPSVTYLTRLSVRFCLFLVEFIVNCLRCPVSVLCLCRNFTRLSGVAIVCCSAHTLYVVECLRAFRSVSLLLEI